ncbi:Amidohydrolase family protein [Flavobacteriaceae bacterium MAR_2010_188]|nr:Amidohydrolase family protein [Flavobacteriaceae bacterium MAR_2010_188]
MRLKQSLLVIIILIGTNSTFSQNIQVLKGAKIFIGNGETIENGVVIIEGNKIKEIGGNGTKFPANSKVVNLKGKYVMPGLVDAHIHFFQTGFFDSRPDAGDIRDSIPFEKVVAYQEKNPERYYRSYLRSGVTAVYDVGDYSWTLGLQDQNEETSFSPHVAAAGPLLTPAPEESIAIFNIGDNITMIHLGSEAIGRNMVIKNSKAGSTGIKIWGFAPDDPVFVKHIEAVAEEVKKQNNKMIAHATTLKEAKLALRVGAQLLVHSVEDSLVDTEFLDLLKKNNALYNPTLIVGKGYYNTYKAVLGENFKIRDPYQVVDTETKHLLENATKFESIMGEERIVRLKAYLPKFQETLDYSKSVMQQNLMRVYREGGTIVVGTDAGNPGTLHGISFNDEIEAMQSAGIPAEDLIIMATKNGAIAMDRLDDFGTLEEGKIADLIILDQDPSKDISNLRSITHVMRNGELKNIKNSEEFLSNE